MSGTDRFAITRLGRIDGSFLDRQAILLTSVASGVGHAVAGGERTFQGVEHRLRPSRLVARRVRLVVADLRRVRAFRMHRDRYRFDRVAEGELDEARRIDAPVSELERYASGPVVAHHHPGSR